MAAINLYGDLWGTMAAGEGTGKNPISSAEGFGQVLDSTYDDWVKRYREKYPWMPATKQEYVNSPLELQKRVYDEVIGPNEYGPSLTKGGFDVTPENLAMTNWLGPTGGVNFLKGAAADPNQPGHALASESAVRNNQGVFFDKSGRARTAGEVIDWWKSKGQQAPSVPIPGTNLEASPPPPPSTSPAPPAPPAERSGPPPMNELPTPWQALAGAWNAYMPNVPDWLKRLDDRVMAGLGQNGAAPPGVPLSPAAQQAIEAKKIYSTPASPPMAHQAPLPEVRVGERTVTPGSEPVGAPPAVNPAAAVEAAQAVQNYQSPAQEEYTPWTMENMLRFAAGMAGGETFGQGLSQGLLGFTEGMAKDRKMALERQKVAAMVTGEAQKLIEIGMNPAVAMDIASGRLKGPEATRALQAIGMQGGLSGNGRVTQGNLLVAPDGRLIREVTSQRGGAPIFYDLTTGLPIDRVPPGSTRAENDLPLTQASAVLERDATAKIPGIQTQVYELGRMRDLLNNPELITGSSIKAHFQRAIAKMTGSEQQKYSALAEQITNRIHLGGMSVFQGTGAVTEAEQQILRRAGPNWTDDPEAAKIILASEERKALYELQANHAWTSASSAEKRVGYMRFMQKWRDENPLQAFAERMAKAVPQGSSGEPDRPGPPLKTFIR